MYLSENDLSRLANEMQMDYTAFIKTWCRWVMFTQGRERLSLREKSNFDCIFWNDGCVVYQARPLQCRAFPFWDSLLCSRQAWEAAAIDCPGMNNGELHDGAEIAAFLGSMEKELVIEREMPRLGNS